MTAREIRTLGPLMTLRSLPARRRVGRARVAGDVDVDRDRPLLELFESQGFVPLRRHGDGDERRVEYGAAGRFWSLTGNQPRQFADADAFDRFDEPGNARIWFELTVRAVERGTEVTTTTIVDGTDRASERRFAPYWTVIRLPSGLIRRSWLAAIERRSQR